ncbi:hypothetical protein OEG86_20595 [Hoeflea alexandrii]|uniref:hypothetical protein n=1 Tax=Hoeflea alexandrii TaxID=288436 RepID=UPI00226F1624|nr:hypothetical protein [Hoeflea alexandrii]MCY0154229.1 hypothetical protein [Hoeflea alexandrii]
MGLREQHIIGNVAATRCSQDHCLDGLQHSCVVAFGSSNAAFVLDSLQFGLNAAKQAVEQGQVSRSAGKAAALLIGCRRTVHTAHARKRWIKISHWIAFSGGQQE